MIIAIERSDTQILNPKASTVFEEGDIVWFVSPEELRISKFISA